MNDDDLFTSDSYPTPHHLIDRMLSRIDFTRVESVLEPSTGKGDIADAVKKRLESAHFRRYSKNEFDVDCIEINTNFQAILKGKEHRVIYDDFLRFDTYKRYHLIVMNPPFSNGDKHLLHAIEIMERTGGGIVCILNAETIRNPNTYSKQKLVDELDRLGADIEYLKEEFKNAERRTGVEIALIRIDIPNREHTSVILDTLERAEQVKEIEIGGCTEVAENEFIKATVVKFNFEVKAGLQLISDYKAILPLIQKSFDGDKYSSGILKLEIDTGKHYNLNENEFVREVRGKYWRTLFLSPQFTERFTSNLIDRCHQDVDRLKDYDFNEYNIRTIRLELMKDYIMAVEETIVKLFDDLTHKHHWFDEDSKNRHYFTGWKTNQVFKINKKVILPLDLYSHIARDGRGYGDYRTAEKVHDIDKTLRYLSRNEEPIHSAHEVLRVAKDQGQTKNIEFDFFTLTCYKKGTAHITFTNLELLKKFNFYGCQKKGWLPPIYGHKEYSEMSEEERSVIDSYEGEESYSEVLKDGEYYLSGVTLMLEGEHT